MDPDTPDDDDHELPKEHGAEFDSELDAEYVEPDTGSDDSHESVGELSSEPILAEWLEYPAKLYLPTPCPYRFQRSTIRKDILLVPKHVHHVHPTCSISSETNSIFCPC
jgi:hypothetical protein